MKKYIFFFLVACAVASIAGITHFQISPNDSQMPVSSNGNYEKEWKIIDSLENEGLVKSALAEVEKLYTIVKKENNYAQVVKCLIYKSKYQMSLKEDELEEAIKSLEEEAKTADFPVRPILQSMLAQLYGQYMDNYYWEFQNRTETVDFNPGDLQTYTPGQILEKASTLYLESIKDDRLKTVAIENFDAITSGKDANDEKVRPTLYDFLVFRAIEYFTDERTYLTEPAYKFYLDDEKVFSPASEFVEVNFETRDTQSNKLKTLNLFREVLDFHLNDADPSALIDADLLRLQFVYNNFTGDRKGDLYENALSNLLQRYEEDPAFAEISYYLAAYYFNRGNQFRPLPHWMKAGEKEEDPTFKWDYKKAYEICETAISKYPDSYGADHCKGLQNQITAKHLSITTENVLLPEQPGLTQLVYRNIPTAYFKVIKLDEALHKKIEEVNWHERIAFLNTLTTQESWSHALPDDGDYREHSVEIALPELKPGQYALMASGNSQFTGEAVSYLFFQASHIAYLQSGSYGYSNRGLELMVMHRETGKPLKGVKADFYRQDYNNRARGGELVKIASYSSDVNGRILPQISERANLKVIFTYENEALFSERWFGNYPRAHHSEEKRKVHFFLDRAIYRPGQTIYFKGLALKYNNDGLPQIETNRFYTVELMDANHQKVSELELTTNEYGTFNGTFKAPSSGLTGQMYLRTYNSSHNFRVEEYKRPKFEVKFEPLTGSYRLNEEITATGKAEAYAGNNIDGATVTYRVVRQTRFPWWSRRGYWFPWPTEEMEITNGQTETDGHGNFKITFTAIPDKSIPADVKPEFSYTMYADVTDITGETQSNETHIRVGYVAMEIDFPLPEKLSAPSIDSLPIITRDLNGNKLPTNISLTIEPLKSPGKFFLKRYWEKPDRQVMDRKEFEKKFPHFAYADEDEMESWEALKPVFQKEFNTANSNAIDVSQVQWEPGAYVFTIQAKDEYGTPVEVKKYAVISTPDSKKPPVPSAFWFENEKTNFKPGETANWTVRTSDKEVHYFQTLQNRLEMIAEGWEEASPLEKGAHTVSEKDRGGFSLDIFAVRRNRLYRENILYTIPWSNKDLKIEYMTFRDKLKPGQQEEWQVKISGPRGEQVAAEMVAGMYDASLDAFVPHSWGWDFYPTFTSYGRAWSEDDNFGSVSGLQPYYPGSETFSPGFRKYRSLNWFSFSPSAIRNLGNRNVNSLAAPTDGIRIQGEMREKEEFAMADQVVTNGAAAPPPSPSANQDKPVQVRTNLDETVFFFPNLYTDKEGNIIIKFTMNEALTRWKFMTFAHTKDLKTVSGQKEIVTQKELMVVPNPPRFFREGDEIEFTAKVSNLTEHELSGNARLELFDALTNEPVDSLFGNTGGEMAFSAKAGQSARLAWKLRIPEGKATALVHRVVARAGNFSDGEESISPVVSNRMLVTEAMPLPVRGKQTREFVFESLKNNTSSTLQHQGLTLEYTSNPAWYAVQALPYLMEYPYECNEQVFNRFYANSLATHISNAHPKIKAVFDKWRNYQPEALLSNLSKNEELKTALLEETPWVLQAQSEEAQKQNIGLLFDLNRMSYEMQSTLRKLADRQLGNGGWAWFNGGKPNWHITQYTVEGIGRLHKLGVELPEEVRTSEMIKEAVKYCDYSLSEEYKMLEARVKAGKAKWEDDHLSSLIVHYLYARSFFLPKEYSRAGKGWEPASDDAVAVDDNLKKIIKYYLGQADKYWTKKGLYEQGMLALSLNRYSESGTPEKIVRSLKERSLSHEELGTYWKYPKGWWWYQAPIETQALMVEVFSEVANDAAMVDDLRIWLLKHKQTNHWKTTKATAAAVYAILIQDAGNGTVNWILEDKPVKISFPNGGNEFERKIEKAQADAEAGTGYFKVRLEGDLVSQDLSTVKVENPNQVVSWGSLYWQYFEQLDKIKTFEETPLTLKKQLFNVILTDTGEKIQPIDKGSALKPGDKLKVRIELRVDRDMEYVHMKDMRASGFEPIHVLSSYKWQGGLGYYESTKDLATHFFFDYLPKGTYVFEYPLWVAHEGDFSNGVTTIQCMYAPEFTSHSEGIRVSVGE